MNKTVKELAYAYWKKGWSVIPLYNYTKKPCDYQHIKLFPQYKNAAGEDKRGWKPFQERLATPEEMELWFDKNTATGVGLITGKLSGIVVVDVDSYKDGGMDFAKETPLKVKTARGGTHYFFRYKEPIKSTGFKTDVNIEIKADGGYTALPGTQVKYDDKIATYSWMNGDVAKDFSNVPHITPDDLSSITSKKSMDVKNIDELLNVPTGYQHNSLRTLINKMLNRFPQDEWDIASDFILEKARAYQPPVADRETLALIKDCKAFIIGNPKDKKEDKFDKNRMPEITIYKGQEILKAYDEMILKSGEGLSTTYPILDNLFKFQPQHLTLVSAPTFVGKTLFTINMAYRMAQQGTRVAYFSLEMGLWVTSKIKKIMGNDGVPETLQLIESEDYLTGKQVADTMDRMPEIDIVFIDHTHYLKREGKGLEGIDDLIMRLQFIAKSRHIPVVLISHIRKLNENRPPQLDDLRDTSYLQQVPSVILMLHREKNSDEDIVAGAYEMKKTGFIYIRKNRMTGILKAERFAISDNEEFVMEDNEQFNDLLNKDEMNSMVAPPVDQQIVKKNKQIRRIPPEKW